jgi:serine/threonine-protein kinase mTOR
VRNGFENIDLKVWIEVIPQLLARVDIKDPVIRKSLIDLLEKISMKFPQALIYSLSVLQKSKTNERRKAADQLIDKLKLKQPILIEQATMISDELIRCAIVLSEIWNEAIEEASRIYFG